MCRRLMYPILFLMTFGLGQVHAQDVQWIKAVYWDANYWTNWATEADSVAVRDACVAAGYEVLDATQLKTWMQARIADKKYSVVVFARDIAPDTVVETVTATCTLRKYLDAGGKIVFYADIPFWNIGATGQAVLSNPQTAGASAILGFNNDIAVWDSNTQVKITANGAKWGLTTTWASLRPISASAGVTILATDGAGNAAAWVRNYGKNPAFCGFVRLYDRLGRPPVEDILRVAEYAGYKKAGNPAPAHGAVGVTSPLMTWETGDGAMSHNVYFGTSPELGAADLVAPRTTWLMYYHVPQLQPGVTYYWRVDEFDAASNVTTGDLWSFTAAPTTAWAPQPSDGAKYVDPEVDLAWSRGMNATAHDVYFGTDRAAVEAGTGGTLKALKQAQVSYTPGTLERGTTYYWRVDETIGANKVTGAIWSFTVRPVIAKADPALLGWWKLEDEKSGTAVDYSGWDHYGTLNGGPQWVEGYFGDALSFDGVDDYVDFGNPADWPAAAEPRSMCGWGKTDSVATGWRWIAAYGSAGTGLAMFIGMNGTDLYGGGYGDDVLKAGFWEIGAWHHIALTYDGTTARLYADGIEVASAAKTWNLTLARAHIGRQVNSAAEFWDGLIDDVRVYNVALTPEQVKETMRGDPLLAWNPQPKNGVNIDVHAATALTWSPGETADTHDVYFGTDRAAVKTADPSGSQYLGRQGDTDFALDGLVEFGGGSYFWRIDEVEADGTTVHKGVVWGFTVPKYLIVDDFESYNDEEDKGTRIYETWIDGITNGTTSMVGYWDPPFAEQTIVHGGNQSMPLDYNNINTPYYAEAEREFSPLQDWTTNGVTDLSLWFCGRAAPFLENPAGQYTVSANSIDIWGNSDNFRYVYKTLNGDGAISAKVISMTNTSAWAKAGVMIRDTVDPIAAYAFMFPTPEGRRAFQNRPSSAAGAVSAHSGINQVTLPFWVKVERKANAFTAYYSTDGTNWIKQPDTENTGTDASPNPQTISMGGSTCIGLAVASNNGQAGTCVAVFSDVVITGSVSGQFKVADIGSVSAGNDPDKLYVVVEDSAGKTKTVTHPDPTAAVTLDWTEWKIPLTDLAGVSLSKVKKLYIGVGDSASPKATRGRIYLDDIYVVPPAGE